MKVSNGRKNREHEACCSPLLLTEMSLGVQQGSHFFQTWIDTRKFRCADQTDRGIYPCTQNRILLKGSEEG